MDTLGATSAIPELAAELKLASAQSATPRWRPSYSSLKAMETGEAPISSSWATCEAPPRGHDRVLQVAQGRSLLGAVQGGGTGEVERCERFHAVVLELPQELVVGGGQFEGPGVRGQRAFDDAGVRSDDGLDQRGVGRVLPGRVGRVHLGDVQTSVRQRGVGFGRLRHTARINDVEGDLAP